MSRIPPQFDRVRRFLDKDALTREVAQLRRGVQNPDAILKKVKAVMGVPSALLVATFLLTTAVTDFVDNVLESTLAKGCWVFVLATLVYIGYQRAQRKVVLNASTIGQSGDDKLSTRRGAVILVGLDSNSESNSVPKLLARMPNLEYVAFIGTPETKDRGVVNAIQRLMSHQLDGVKVHEDESGNAASLSDFQANVTSALGWMRHQGLESHEMVVDVSEGRRPMYMGAHMAAFTDGVESQYLASAWNHRENRPIPGVEMVKIIVEM